MANPLEEALQALGIDTQGSWGLGQSGPGTGLPQLALPQESITNGLDAMLATLNERQLASEASRTSSGVITPMPDELLAQLLAPPEAASTQGPTAANGFAIPEFSDAEYQRAQQKDWKTRAKDFRKGEQGKSPTDGWDQVAPGVYKEQGTKNYSNVMDAKGAPSMDPSIQRQAPGAEQLSSNLASRVQAITNATDSRVQLQMFQQLQMDAAQEQTKIVEELRKQAEIKMNVPQLEQLLARNESDDRKHPQWAAQQGDSIQTEKVRQELDKARMRAGQEANSYIKSNIRLNAIDSQIKGLSTIVSYDMKKADKIADREDRQQEAKDNIELNKKLQAANSEAKKNATEQEKADIMMAQTSPGQRARLAIIDPSQAGKSDQELAIALAKGWSTLGAEDKAVLQAPEEALLPMSLQGSTKAMRALAAAEEAKTGKPAKEVMDQVAAMQRLTKDTQKLDRIASDLLGSKEGEGYKQYQAAKNAGIAGNKEEKAAADKMMISLVMRHADAVEQGKWLGDLSSWQLRDPILDEARKKVVKAGRKPDIVAVTKMAIAAVPQSQRQRIGEVMRQEIFFNAKKGGLIANTNPDAAYALVMSEVTKSRIAGLFSNMGDVIDDTLQPANEGLAYLFGDRK